MFLKLEEKSEKINYLKYLDFNDYMISLSNFKIEKADLPDNYTKIKYSYSWKDDFYDEVFNIEFLQSFIESKILKHKNVYEKAFHSENSHERTLLFKDFLFNLHKGSLPKIKQIEIENGIISDNENDNLIMKKNAAIIYGLLFCEGDDWVKVKIFFNLFKENEKLKKSDDLNLFLFMLFITASYSMCYSRSQLSKYATLGEVDEDIMSDAMKIFQIDTTKKLVEFTNTLLFGKEQNNELIYEQFRQMCQITEKKESASFLFSSRGIRYMHKEVSGVVFEKRKKKKKKK
jgi:Arc/MetJ family transcription regulator